jgi:RNA polymerase sigma-70 factor (ECF subfamily)
MRTDELTAVLDVEDLALRIRTWDDQAVADFSRIFGPRLRAYFLWRGLGSWDAEDLSVTCVSKIVMKIDQYERQTRGGFEGWVFTVARNTLTDWFRKRMREVPLPDDYDAADKVAWTNPEAELALAEGVMQLSESDQRVVGLRYFEGRPFDEISAALGVKPGTARTRYCRALKRLVAILKKDPRVDAEALRGDS